MTIVTKGMGVILKGRAQTNKLNLTSFEEKIKKIAEERELRKLKQDKEVEKRTGLPFKQAEDPE
jgi:hypothetical protein